MTVTVRAAYRLERETTAALARFARRRGWTPAVLPYAGYGGNGRVRVLARALLAPPATDPAARRDIPGWRRLLTLELPGTEIGVEIAGSSRTVRSGDGGFVDESWEVDVEPGATTVTFTAGERHADAPLHVASSDATFGVVCDIDDTAMVTGIRHPLRAAYRTFLRSSSGRHPVPGMSDLLRALVEGRGNVPVIYLSNGAWNLAGPVMRFLDRNGFPPGALLMTDWGPTRGAFFRSGQENKRRALDRLAREMPAVRWVLVGDTGEHDPDIYAEHARRFPDRVIAVALRDVMVVTGDVEADDFGTEHVGGVPVVRSPDGHGLLRGLVDVVDGVREPDEPSIPPGDARLWFLSAQERGNRATRLRPWTDGNQVKALVHGRTYFPVLLEALRGAAEGDLVLLADWRGDPDELLTDDGPTVAQALSQAAGRGALVKGLLWRSHLDRLQFSSEQNRDLSEDVNDDGGEVLLDQRVRPMGSHHQKFVVVRHAGSTDADVAFVGGIDLGHSRRDDAEHGGDPQTQPFSDRYGDSPAWHDVQLQLRGPAVRDVEDVFRERWEDPAALTRLPWHVVPDVLRRLDRDPSHLPEPTLDPPATGTCSVQLLRTYPNRHPGYPFAPDGERSAARGYAKALRRARRLVYIEDQYLWSTDVAQVFADALRREPELHLVAVVPRWPDQDGRFRLPPELLGHSQALEMVRAAGGDRVQVVDVENRSGEAVYVHAKVCIVDDVWAAVGSDNFNRRSWTHDSELTAAVLDGERDEREPADPGGLGDGARRFARELRLELMREHLDRGEGDDGDLLDPTSAAEAVRESADTMDRWYAGGRSGERPPGRLRQHRLDVPPAWQRWLSAPVYRMLVDPDGRPPLMKLRRTL